MADSTDRPAPHDETEARLAQAMDLAGLGLVTVDYDADTAVADAQAAALFDLPADVPVARARLHARIHPDDRAAVEARVAAAIAGDGAFTAEHRILRPDGSVAVVQVRKRVVFEGGGPAGGPRRAAHAVVIVADRTQARAAAARSRTTTDTLETALLAAHLGTFEYDPEVGVPICDARARALLGLTATVPLDAFASRVHPDDRAQFVRFCEAAVGPSAEPSQTEYRLHMPDGSVRWIETAAWARDDGRGLCVVGTVSNVTERREALAALEQSEARFRDLADAAPQLVWTARADGTVTYYNRRRTLYVGLDAQPDGTWAWNPVLHLDDRARTVAAWQAAVDTGAPYECEHRIQMRDGTFHTHLSRAEPIRDGHGRVDRWYGSATDVDALVTARAALAESEARAQRTLDGLPIFAGICSPAGAVEYINRPGLDVHGVALEGVVGQPFHETVWWAGDPLTQARIAAAVAQAAAGATAGIEAPYRVGDDARTVEFGAFPLLGSDGAVSHIVVSGYDVTDRARAQADLRALNDALEDRVAERTAELERSNAELDQFAYVASHDLKAPLRAIDSLASWISEDAAGALPPESERHLALLRSRAERMERLLDSLLAYSRAGRQDAAVEAVDTAALVRETVALVAPPEGVDVRVEGSFPAVVTARAPLELAVRNLVSNAIKHGRAGGCVAVSARTVGGWAEFTVADDGPGIAEGYRERVFGMFQTLRPRDEVEGSGMGLAIVRKTVEAHGGRITLGERPGGGASFRFTWPLTP